MTGLEWIQKRSCGVVCVTMESCRGLLLKGRSPENTLVRLERTSTVFLEPALRRSEADVSRWKSCFRMVQELPLCPLQALGSVRCVTEFLLLFLKSCITALAGERNGMLVLNRKKVRMKHSYGILV